MTFSVMSLTCGFVNAILCWAEVTDEGRCLIVSVSVAKGVAVQRALCTS